MGPDLDPSCLGRLSGVKSHHLETRDPLGSRFHLEYYIKIVVHCKNYHDYGDHQLFQRMRNQGEVI